VCVCVCVCVTYIHTYDTRMYAGDKIESNQHMFQEIIKLKNMYMEEKVYQVIHKEIMHSLKLQIQYIIILFR
jgi:hypothetical protein